MSDLRSGGSKLAFEVLTTPDSFFDDDDEPFLLRSNSGQGAIKSNRKKRKNKGSKKKKKKKVSDDEVELNNTSCGGSGSSNGFIINSNCRSVVETTTTTAVVYEEAFMPVKEKKVYPVISSSVRETPELRQRNTSVFYTELMPMYRIDENVQEMDDSSSSSSSRTGSEFDTELMMKQTAELNVNLNDHHVVGRMLEKDK